MVRGGLLFLGAIAAALLPHRLWGRLPPWLPLESAAFLSGILTVLAGAAVGIPGFLERAGATVSMANQAVLDDALRSNAGYNRGVASGVAGVSVLAFLLLAPPRWVPPS